MNKKTLVKTIRLAIKTNIDIDEAIILLTKAADYIEGKTTCACHVDVTNGEQPYDNCVLDKNNNFSKNDCDCAKNISKKTECPHWKPIYD